MTEIRIKEDYSLSKCCSPEPNDPITGYYSYDAVIKVHKVDCPNLQSVEPERLLTLKWNDLLIEKESFQPESDYSSLEEIDFLILQHHKEYGIDYSLVVARKLTIPKQEAFDRHKKLKELELIQRVDATMVQYRKGIVDNKWIKHRNHTYYDLTEKGNNYLTYYQQSK